MSFDVVNWGNLPVKFDTSDYSKPVVEEAVRHADARWPGLAQKIPQATDTFIGLVKDQGQADRHLAGIKVGSLEKYFEAITKDPQKAVKSLLMQTGEFLFKNLADLAKRAA